MDNERFTRAQTMCAIRSYIQLGERYAKENDYLKGGYFAGDGWGKRCLSQHLNSIKSAKTATVIVLREEI